MTEVYNDAQSASKGEHKMAMEHLFTKLFLMKLMASQKL